MALGEMGMSPAEFWDMPPYLFFLKLKGYQRRENKHGFYFRELFALTFNINRGEETEYLEPQDVLLLPGEKKKRARTGRAFVHPLLDLTPEQLAAIRHPPKTVTT